MHTSPATPNGVVGCSVPAAGPAVLGLDSWITAELVAAYPPCCNHQHVMLHRVKGVTLGVRCVPFVCGMHVVVAACIQCCGSTVLCIGIAQVCITLADSVDWPWV